MTLKNAAMLAFVGMLLVTVLVVVEFVETLTGVMREIVPAIRLVPCFIYFFAGVCVTMFFWTFSRAQR